MKVGILSGTFDPVHDGHLAMAQSALNSLKLDEVWFVPEKQPRSKQGVTDYHHRLRMLDLALEHKPDFYLTEASQEQHSLETLEEIIKNYKPDINHQFFLLFGIDVVKQIQDWQNLERLKELATVVSIGRNGKDADLYLNHPASSKTIRQQIIKKHQPENVNEKVLNYIYENKLYQS